MTSGTRSRLYRTRLLPASPFPNTILFRVGPPLRGLWPELGEGVVEAVVRAGRAGIAAVEDEAIVDVLPVLLGHKLLEILGYLLQIGVVREVEALSEALHMRIGGDAFPHAVELAEDDVRGLVAHAWQGDKLGLGRRHSTLMLCLNRSRRADNGLGLIAEERDG